MALPHPHQPQGRRFVEAVGYGDLTQRFGHMPAGGGFAELGTALDNAVRRLRRERAEAGDDGRLRNALVESAPVALLLVDRDDRVTLANGAARRLLGSAQTARAADYAAAFGADFVHALTCTRPGERRTLPITIEGAPSQALLTAARLARPAGGLRIISVQPIGGELARPR